MIALWHIGGSVLWVAGAIAHNAAMVRWFKWMAPEADAESGMLLILWPMSALFMVFAGAMIGLGKASKAMSEWGPRIKPTRLPHARIVNRKEKP